jgi:hypothetical protein
MGNANTDRNARIPRNAIRIWISDANTRSEDPARLTASLRMIAKPGMGSLVHPLDWPAHTCPCCSTAAQLAAL